jgi:hypothetical protein
MGPVGLAPSLECGKGFLERSAEVGELVEGRGVDTAGIEEAHYQSVAFGSPESLGEHFARDAVKGIIELLVSATAAQKSCEDSWSPSATDEVDDLTGSVRIDLPFIVELRHISSQQAQSDRACLRLSVRGRLATKEWLASLHRPSRPRSGIRDPKSS